MGPSICYNIPKCAIIGVKIEARPAQFYTDTISVSDKAHKLAPLSIQHIGMVVIGTLLLLCYISDFTTLAIVTHEYLVVRIYWKN